MTPFIKKWSQYNITLHYHLGHTALSLFDVLPLTLIPPQVKRMVIISNKHAIYELPHELPNNLILRILGNLKILIEKISKPYGIMVQCPVFPRKMKVLSILAKNC